MQVNPIHRSFDKSVTYKRSSYISNNYSKQLPTEVVFPSATENYFHLKPKYNTVTFCGSTVHILDGGPHAYNMQHFANAISKNMDIEMHLVDINPNNKMTKQLKSLEEQLNLLNYNYKDLSGQYIAIPALASVSLSELQKLINRENGTSILLSPENLRENRKLILAYLKKLYNNPSQYRNDLNTLDFEKQGLEYIFGVITKINKLIKKGGKVYVPAGHPIDWTLKCAADKKGKKQELYNYIATGDDKNDTVSKMISDIKNNKTYNFNLLALSNAHVVNVKSENDVDDYIFAAYDNCITEGERGVYNFSPIRKNGTLIGYSYTDTKSNQYPYNEFPANEEVANIAEFVGKDLKDVIASDKEAAELKYCIDNYKDTSDCVDKLYPVRKVFSQHRIAIDKIDLQGDYVDKSLSLFFRKNQENKIIFPKCDCEGTGKPSVLTMWGSCFSIFNAIKRDIEPNTMPAPLKTNQLVITKLTKRIAPKNKKRSNFYINELRVKISDEELDKYIKKAETALKQDNIEESEWQYNQAVNHISQSIHYSIFYPGYKYIKQDYEEYSRIEALAKKYKQECEEYNKQGTLYKLFHTAPTESIGYHTYKLENSYMLQQYNKIQLLSELYNKLAEICFRKEEEYAGYVCEWASKELHELGPNCEEIISRRAHSNSYIGDIYDKCRCN